MIPRRSASTIGSTSEPVNYRIDVVSFSVVREPAAQTAGRVLCSSPEEVLTAIRAGQLLPDDAREHFIELMLDSKNGLVAAHQVSVGGLAHAIVHPREVLGPVLRVLGVASLVLAHNHPSGDPTPSKKDRALTRQLVEAARLLGLKIHDHLIIGSGTDRWVSLAQRGLV